MIEQGTHKSWLKSCPPNDVNFKCHIKQASAKEIEELIEELPEQGNKTKIAALKAELRKRRINDTSEDYTEYKACEIFIQA